MGDPLIYLVACDPSADVLGAHLMRALREETTGHVQFVGIGGAQMQAAGLASLFDPQELALLGIFEVMPAFRHVLARVDQTITDIQRVGPSILVTIDSWGFTGRIHQRLTRAGSPVPRLRYVAPQVWAWRPGRARQLARWINHLMALYPFEPPYFTAHGLRTTWVGHPVVEAKRGDGDAFRARHGIAASTQILAVLPGSRRGEVTRLLDVFGAGLELLRRRRGPFAIVIPTVPGVADLIKAGVAHWPQTTVVDHAEIADAFAASHAALAASGTVSLELAAAGVPHAIAYRVNPLSALAFRLLRRTKYVNLVNVLLDRFAVPELLQEKCAPLELAAAMAPLMDDHDVRQRQRDAFRTAIAALSPPGGRPTQLAARTVLAAIAR